MTSTSRQIRELYFFPINNRVKRSSPEGSEARSLLYHHRALVSAPHVKLTTPLTWLGLPDRLSQLG
jgi:hypothetical protein